MCTFRLNKVTNLKSTQSKEYSVDRFDIFYKNKLLAFKLKLIV